MYFGDLLGDEKFMEPTVNHLMIGRSYPKDHQSPDIQKKYNDRVESKSKSHNQHNGYSNLTDYQKDCIHVSSRKHIAKLLGRQKVFIPPLVTRPRRN
jgi:hypothetical protein